MSRRKELSELGLTEEDMADVAEDDMRDAAEVIQHLAADLAAARAEIEKYKKATTAGWRADISGPSAKVTVRALDGSKWVHLERLEDLRERAAQLAEHIADNYDGWEPPMSVAGNVAAAIRALSLTGDDE